MDGRRRVLAAKGFSDLERSLGIATGMFGSGASQRMMFQ